MEFDLHVRALREELEQYYSNFDNGEKQLLPALEKKLAEHPEDSAFARKSRMHEFLCGECPVKLFRNTPLFFEIASGRVRFTWGGLDSKVGSYLHISTEKLWLIPYGEALEKDREEGFLHGWYNPVGFDHHCAGYDNLLAWGLNGIIAIVLEWIRNDCDKSIREISQIISVCIYGKDNANK